jgi:SAM-dependent methyltransferase
MGNKKENIHGRAFRSAERLFDFPRLYRAKFAVTGAVLNLVRPFCFKTMVREIDVFREARIPVGSSICEIGCGDGKNYRNILSVVGGARYTGIDINPAMIEHCMDSFPDQNWLVSGLPYPFPDDSFDYCIIVNVLHHLNSPEDITLMLNEAKRMSRNILLFEPLQSENPVLYRLKTLYWAITDGGLHYQRLHEFRAIFEALGLRLEWERFTSPLRHFYGAHLTHAA